MGIHLKKNNQVFISNFIKVGGKSETFNVFNFDICFKVIYGFIDSGCRAGCSSVLDLTKSAFVSNTVIDFSPALFSLDVLLSSILGSSSSDSSSPSSSESVKISSGGISLLPSFANKIIDLNSSLFCSSKFYSFKSYSSTYYIYS